MLQTTPARPSAAAPRIEPSATVTLSTLRTVLRRYALLVLLFTALGAGIAALIVWASVPTYVASAQLLIEAQRQQQLLVFEGSVRGRGVNSRTALAGIGVAIGPCG